MSIRTKNTDRRRPGRWLGAGALLLGACPADAWADPPAALRPPHPLPAVVRASADEILPIDPPPPVVKARERPPGFKYPTPYTKEEPSFFSISSMWERVAGKKEESPPARQPVSPPKLTTTVAHGGHAAAAPVPVAPAPGPIAPAPVLPKAEVPAWRWFGYGAPVPGMNPYAPSGVYAPVNPAFYMQTGATPGAIPAPLLPLYPTPQPQPDTKPTLPKPVPVPARETPTTSEPPALMLMPIPSASEEPPVTPASSSDTPPATLEMPIPLWKPNAELSAPLGASPLSPIFRGHAPEPKITQTVIDAVRHAATGYAERIELESAEGGKLVIQARLLPRIVADRLADRLAALPELAEFQIQMEFVR